MYVEIWLEDMKVAVVLSHVVPMYLQSAVLLFAEICINLE